MRAMLILLLISNLVLTIGAIGEPTSFRFEEAFRNFIQTHKYNGAQIGVLVDNRLAYAKAFGKGHEHTNIELESKHQISAISKAFTSIAILKLYDEGKLKLESKIFGEDGILPDIKPWTKTTDQRIYDISVNNLLYHTAGWDYRHSKVADPILNPNLPLGGSSTKNNSRESKHPNKNVNDVISYVLSLPLDYTPGTKSVVSNLGYVILGRVVEQVTNFTYEEYVKNRILFPCGMMHTRMGKTHRCVNADYADCEIKSNLLDAALGWESNIYDLARFYMCIDGSSDFSVVSERIVKLIISKPKDLPVQHTNTWIGPGFHVNNKGAIWIENEQYTNDLLFFHYGMMHKRSKFLSTVSKQKPKALIVLMQGQNKVPLKRIVHEMIHDESSWPLGNRLIDDVSDVELKVDNHQRIIKYELNEHHLKPYVHAIKQLRYDIKWIQGHIFAGSTIFTIIAEKASKPIYDKYIVEGGLSDRRLESQKLHLEKSNFNLTFLHTYRSYSHDKRPVFLAIYRKHAYKNTTVIRYGEEHFTQPYKKLLHIYEERGFYPTSQSVVHSGFDGLVSFIFEEDKTSGEKKEFRSYCEIGHHRLNKLVMSSYRHSRRLKTLDSSDYFGKPVFSAIFVKEKTSKMAFNSNINEEELMSMLIEQQNKGILPSIIAGYTDKFGTLKYAVYLEPPT